jgi:hypothetical protein
LRLVVTADRDRVPPVPSLSVTVREIRAEATPGADGLPELVVREVIVSRTRVRLFGYQRHDQRGPEPLVALIRRLHRHTRYVAWEDVDVAGPEVRVRRPSGELAPLDRP